jgi:alpha-tubulin suppressor-like RCC1 family protein
MVHMLSAGRTTLRTVADGLSDSTPLVSAARLTGVRAASLANDRGCAIDVAGSAICWGATSWSTGQSSPSPIAYQTFAGLDLVDVSAAEDHVCALSGAGSAYCWGANSNGQLGDGTTTARSAPSAVSGELAFAQLASGGNFTCGLATSGSIYCWGANDHAQLGTTTGQSSAVPVAINLVGSWKQLVAAGSSACALSAAGVA